MRALYILVAILLLFGSCRKDFGTIISKGNLEFSKDTVLLNRVFDDISSSTQSFKVYNRSNDDITIPRIALGRGENSFYRLNVDGIAGKSFENIDILAKDSIYVFVEATVDFDQVTDAEFFYRDSVVFYAETSEQDVKLEALVMDVNLIRPDRAAQPDGSYIYEEITLGMDADGEMIAVRGVLLEGNTTFTNEKPYLIYDYIGVPSGATLTIEEGATLYFHNNSGIIVQNDASLKVEGSLQNPVLFEDDRLEPDFEDIPGLWGTIWMMEGSKDNEIDYAIIKNNSIGVLVDSKQGTEPTLIVKNTQIYNTANFGLWGRGANVLGENVVIGNNGLSSLACTMGGVYNFTHCTFANYWSNDFRQFPTVLINNFLSYYDTNGNEVIELKELQAVNFTNCIIEGNQNIEFLLDKLEGSSFNYNVKNCMLRFQTTNSELLANPLYDFTNTDIYQQIILNGTPHFKDTELNDYLIGQDSDAINKADHTFVLQIPVDILGIDRTTAPDIGAYQHVVFEEE